MMLCPDVRVTWFSGLLEFETVCEVSGFVCSTIVAVLSAVYCGGLLR